MYQVGLDEIRKIQLKILEAVVEFCELENITYYLSYGSLIGAVRHQGYIPWDDDIDLVMLRSDYERFIKKFNDYHDQYKVYTANNMKWYPLPFAKVSYEGSVLIEDIEDNNKLKKNYGINIDIFPIDFIPEGKIKQIAFISILNILKKILLIKRISKDRIISRRKKFLVALLKLPILLISPNMISRLINKLARMYSDGNLVGNLVFSNTKDIVSKDTFSNTILLNFENLLLKAPVKYDEWLRNYYGDYMILPPENERKSHHSFKAYLK